MANTFSWYWSKGTHSGWEKLRRRGALHFVLIRGVIAWGGLMFAFFTLPPLMFDFPWPIVLTPPLALKIAAVWIGCGLAWGGSVWWINEWLYRRHAFANAP